MSRQDELRLMAKVARMYYVQGIRQQGITERLQIHQSTECRVLLKRARQANLVRFSVTAPPGIYSDLERSTSAATFMLIDAVVVDCAADDDALVRDLGAATAYYLETTVKPGTKIGISSWSRSLFAMVDALHPGEYGKGGKVVQILGGVGNLSPAAGGNVPGATLRSRHRSEVAVLLQAPAVVGSVEARRVLSREPLLRKAIEHFEHLDLALVGIGAAEPSKLLAKSGNVFSREERAELSRLSAGRRHLLQILRCSGRTHQVPADAASHWHRACLSKENWPRGGSRWRPAKDQSNSRRSARQMDQFAYSGPQDRRGFAFHGRRVSPQFLFFRTIVSHPDFAPILRLEKGWGRSLTRLATAKIQLLLCVSSHLHYYYLSRNLLRQSEQNAR